jgi:hypothetical protein
VPGLLRLVRTMREVSRDILIVDSSDPPQYRQLRESLRSERLDIHRVLPLGWGDAYRSYGTSRARTNEVVQIDSDEAPNPDLVQRLAQGLTHSAAIIPRRESNGDFTYHLRWYRKDSVRFEGPSFAYPRVSGEASRLGQSSFLYHEPFENEERASSNRWKRYVVVDSLERPLTMNGLRHLLLPSRASRQSEQALYSRLAGGKCLDRPQSEVYLALEAARTLLREGSPHLAWERYRYGRFRIRWIEHSTLQDREWFRNTARTVVEAGGLLRYLNLTDPDYLEALTATFPWNLDPVEVLIRLVRVRMATGAPANPDIWRG